MYKCKCGSIYDFQRQILACEDAGHYRQSNKDDLTSGSVVDHPGFASQGQQLNTEFQRQSCDNIGLSAPDHHNPTSFNHPWILQGQSMNDQFEQRSVS